jgi:hypothetical protein
MSTPLPPKKAVTASELMGRLRHDPQYQARMERAKAHRQESIQRQRLNAAPVVQDLKNAGFAIKSLDELRRSGTSYTAAIPVLIKWLPLVSDVLVKDSIVRALSVPWAKPIAARPLIAEFQATSELASGLKWTIGNALAVVADDGVFNEIAKLVREKRHGNAREMLAVALGNMVDVRAVDLLLNLLHDEDVVGHALIALGKLKVQKARPQIESLLKHRKQWVRKEAQKALANLDN